ncbi:serine acetyltransferase [Hoylesella oralis]|uniref:serine O-acetyltransferase n=1 Tax=Hoylesella oralis TaxID=28134 RepID=UPI0028EF65E6|nr:serine acetyltransferase [Hoylesella oralis]
MNNDIFLKNVAILSKVSEEEERATPAKGIPLPSVEALRDIVELVKVIVFPGFFDRRQTDSNIRSYHIGVNMERLFALLQQQICLALLSEEAENGGTGERNAKEMALRIIDCLPEIKRLLYTDVEAIFNDDPSVSNISEVIFCYPVVEAMLHYRVAHEILSMDVPVIPRIITEQAHAKTGIDIHPGAQIGEFFSIDHGTGVVIGETCVIGNHVTLYQGVTLGAKNFKLDSIGRPLNVPRHPIIEDNVTVYSNSTLLGRITIGHDTVIGGNIWVTNSVPPHSKILQSKALDVSFTGGLGI